METVTETRTCRGPCGRELPETREFYYYNPRSTTKLRGKCIECYKAERLAHQRANAEEHNAKQRKWRKENPEAFRSIKLKYRYGITLDDYKQMLSGQDGRCAICGSRETKSQHKYLYVDHCHKTGKVRGLLCYHCNSTLGYMRDNPETLRSAIAYLEQNSGA